MVGDRRGQAAQPRLDLLLVMREALEHAHPTQNEAVGEAFLALAGKPLHAHN